MYSIKDQLIVIQSNLSNWAKDMKGTAIIAHDLNHMWIVSANNSESPKAVIAFAGEEIRGDLALGATLGRVDRNFEVMISRGKGFTADRGQTLVKDDVSTGRPFYDLLEEARDIVRNLPLGQDDDGCIDYHGIRPALVDQDYPLDMYIISFSVGTQLAVIRDSAGNVLHTGN